MARTHITRFTVEFGDCDPAHIVFYPNFFRWMDAASLHYFRAAGVPNWHQREAADGVLGTPLVDAKARFIVPATYGDEIEIETTIAEWRNKSFVRAASHPPRRRAAGGGTGDSRVRAAPSGRSRTHRSGRATGGRARLVRRRRRAQHLT